jgi:predicted transcriptional regulator
MVRYLCQNIDLNSILKCSFSLSDAELKILKEIVSSDKELCVNDLAKKFERDRSTIQKIIFKLSEKNLIEKKKKKLQEGGYVYYYIPKSKTALKQQMLNNVEEWHNNVKKEIKRW